MHFNSREMVLIIFLAVSRHHLLTKHPAVIDLWFYSEKKETAMTCREKLEVWFDNPNKPPEAWMRLTFSQIGEQAGVSTHNACVQLPRILAKRMGKSVKEVREMRMEFRSRHGLA